MSQPPGSPDQGPVDPWATPTGPVSASQPAYGQPAYGQPPYGQPAYPPQYGSGPSGYGYPAPPRTNGKAQAALWAGIAALVLSCCLGGLLGFVPVIFGVLARREVRASEGQQIGAGMALAGIITGALALVVSLLLLAGLVVLIVHGDVDSGSSTPTGGTAV